MENLDADFKQITGYTPMRWQRRLFEDYFSGGNLPTSVSVPTGLGKTAVMAIWLIALARQMTNGGQRTLPRRLVYVVDRRAVVDQATQFAETLRENLAKDEAQGLRAALGLGDGKKLPISTLRGQFVDNREWLEDPAKPAIIVGTVDMIGSRLLFEGYGVSRKMRPYHAGMLGADALVLLDEAHLVPPFEALLADIAAGTERYGENVEAQKALVPKFQLLPLSATGRRQTVQPFVLKTEDFRIGDEVVDLVADKRLHAQKHLTLKELGDRKLEDALAEQAWRLAHGTDSGHSEAQGELFERGQADAPQQSDEVTLQPVRVIVFCNSRDVAENVKTALDKQAKKTSAEGRIELFVGARRVRERTEAQVRLEILGFLPCNGAERSQPSFLVATSAGEVGVDLDADHMVCDFVAWERMVQRFGRVNRRGDEDRRAEIVVLSGEPEPKKATKVALEKKNKGETLDDKETKAIEDHLKVLAEFRATEGKVKAPFGQALTVQQDGSFDVSPESLRQLSEHAASNETLSKLIADASSPAPLRPALNRALVDAWAMTSLPEHTGRPDVAPWLRGWADDEPQTTVAWRKCLPVRGNTPIRKKEIEDYFEAAPLHASETLETESRRVQEWLLKRAKKIKESAKEDQLKPDAVVAMLLNVDGRFVQHLSLQDITQVKDMDANGKRRFQTLLFGKTLVMDARFGGLSNGLLKDDANDTPLTTDDDTAWMPSADGIPVIRFRVQEQGRDDNEPMEDVWRESLRFDLQRNADGEATRWLSIQKWRDTSNNENDRAAGRPQALTEHQSWAADKARSIAQRLGLPDDYVCTLSMAARLHDEGKKAKRWQRAFRAERDARQLGIDEPLAKTRGPINQQVLGRYRHEFGSLPYAQNDADFKKLSPDMQDLVLHLIAAHHGFARPLIATDGCEDAPPSALEERAREVALRYARLQKHWGPWGLAWWEALLRAADAQASKQNDDREGA